MRAALPELGLEHGHIRLPVLVMVMVMVSVTVTVTGRVNVMAMVAVRRILNMLRLQVGLDRVRG